MNYTTNFGLVIIVTAIVIYAYQVFVKKSIKWNDFTDGSIVCSALVFFGLAKILIGV